MKIKMTDPYFTLGDLDGSVSAVIERLQFYERDYEKPWIDITFLNADVDASLHYWRDPTPEEVEAIKKREEREKRVEVEKEKRKLAHKRALYERLKREFEGE